MEQDISPCSDSKGRKFSVYACSCFQKQSMHFSLNCLSHRVALTICFKLLIIWKSPSIQILSEVVVVVSLFRKQANWLSPTTKIRIAEGVLFLKVPKISMRSTTLKSKIITYTRYSPHTAVSEKSGNECKFKPRLFFTELLFIVVFNKSA